MIRAATTTLGFVFILASTAPIFAQSGDTANAVDEAVRRQGWTVELRQKLGEAAQAEQRHDIVTAAKLYQTANGLSQKIGTGVDAETKTAINGINRVSLALAQQAQQHGDYKEADGQIRAALLADPKNPVLLGFKKNNDALLNAQAGHIPSADVVATVPEILSNKVVVATAVQDGKLLYELGKWDAAEAKLKQALVEDPHSVAANYYMGLIQEARYKAADLARDLQAKKRIVEIEDLWQRSVTRDLLPVPNPYARTNLIHTGSGRQAIMSKLDRIQLNDVKYDDMELKDVIRGLSDEARKRDPDKTGINFLILADSAGSGGGAPGAVDPTTGLPASALPTESVDVGSVRIKISSPLGNVRLADVLDAIVKTSEKPIKYSIEDYAVVFSVKTSEPTPLYIRTFHVDPNTFVQGLEGVGAIIFGATASSSGGSGGGGGGSSSSRSGGGGGGVTPGQVAAVQVASGGSGGGGGGKGGSGSGISYLTRNESMETVQASVRQFFAAAGVDLSQPGKALFFNDRRGTLFVKGTLQDLDTIEAAIQTLNITPPQINIRAKFIEVAQTDQKALGVNWYLGNTLMGDGKIGLQGGTAPSFTGQSSAANPPQTTVGGVPLTAFPGNINSGTTLAPSATDQLITGGLRNVLGAPAIGTLTGILTDPQFRVVVNALETRTGVDILNSPEVTTVSGRQTHIEVTDLISIVTGISANQTSSGSSGSTSVGSGGNGAVGSTIQPTVDTLPFGPSLDVIPYVSADEYTIQMTIIPTLTEFLGYDTSTFLVAAQGSSGGTLSQSVPLPRSRVRQVTTTCVVWDGQTIVLGGLITENTTKTKDKVPVLGDLPLFGKLFRSESNSREKKNLLIFVTPTIIDPAGNRVHSEDEMPFAHSAIPAQHAAARP